MKSIRSRRRSSDGVAVAAKSADQDHPSDVALKLQFSAFELFARQTYSNVSIKDIGRPLGIRNTHIPQSVLGSPGETSPKTVLCRTTSTCCRPYDAWR